MTLRDALHAGRTMLMDGAMGTELIHRGFRGPSILANVEQPDLVRQIHEEYVGAGAEVLLANSFLWPLRGDARHGLQNVIHAAIQLARSASPRFVLASIGPTGGEVDFPSRDELLQSTAGLQEADGVFIETASDTSALDAGRWFAEEYPNMPVIVSFHFGRDAFGLLKTRRGLAPDTIAAQAGDLAGLGFNCGCELQFESYRELVIAYRAQTGIPLVARPSAGSPIPVEGSWRYPLGPEAWAREAEVLRKLGIACIGGCCGTTPEHIRLLAASSC